MNDGQQLLSWEELEELVDSGQEAALVSYMDQLDSRELIRAVCRLGTDTQVRLLSLLSPENAADLIVDMPDAEVAEIFEELPAGQAATIVSELSAAEGADLIGELNDAEAEAILEKMIPSEADSLRELVEHDPDSAGGLMLTDYLAFNSAAQAGNVIQALEDRLEEYAHYEVQYVYVTDQENRLIGVLNLRDLLISRRTQPIGRIMQESLSVNVGTPLEELRNFFAEYDFLGAPVVDDNNCLVGVVRRGTVQEALVEQLEDNQLKLQGIIGGEEFRSMPVVSRSRRRLSWLGINIFLNLIAASVIAMYQDTLQSVIALAIFLPIVSDMSGCSGSQAMAVSMRELALGIVKPRELLYVWSKELAVGIINGLFLGAGIGLVAWIWKGSLVLGVVIGVALALNTVIAVTVGGLIPLVLKRLHFDPAIASGPILTTITDLMGFLLLLSIAAASLPLIGKL
jgi:magnesium transporter